MNLEEYLREQGFERIPLTPNAAGHFQSSGSLNGRPITIIVDTGAGSTVISLDLAQELGLDLAKLPNVGGGAGGVSLPIYKVFGAELRLANTEPKVPEFIAMDLSHINEGMACKGCSPVDAILGANVFESYSAVIDYGSSSLYLKM